MTALARSHETPVCEDPASRFLSVGDVSVSIGRAGIVRSVSFTAQAGELLAIIGPSGSGKTTLLKAITGERSYSGRIELAGRDVRATSPEDQAEIRGVLPQASHLSFPLTVAEVIGLGLLDLRAGRPARAGRIADALHKVGLSGFEGRTYQDLSGGEQQRVQLARVLCQVWEPVSKDGVPRWLFLDEPVSSLDIKHQYQIMALAADYARRGGGVVSVMHDLNLTARFADKVAIMKQGRLLDHGPVENMLESRKLSETFEAELDVIRSGDSIHVLCRE
ncbi:heme ABC transporter ATP-binding protein [Roseibium denhamense]|uniref:Iron complex transport system ATP-binding protein n=1 Tax=Roseibium denhamense TaxID=76305 RepID=A0ABY1P5Q5_9HYPH|nr:heme ABC transporter ATP-binding protein [Roseibium denhamense]MTI07145.1 heme ABC transporter ATP-binding protein [Roseibium denhamense]SMP26850.1 iron complex transport system ATP-binding protein [Roseibium denhamense]